jgi:hypothetical protein
MKKAALFSVCILLASCGQGVDHESRVWGGSVVPPYEQDYSRKADSQLIRSKEINSGSDCIGHNIDGICHGTVISNE